MKVILVLISLLSIVSAGTVFMGAQSAVHEILAGVGFLSFVVSAAALAVIQAIERAAKKLERTGAASASSSVRYGAS